MAVSKKKAKVQTPDGYESIHEDNPPKKINRDLTIRLNRIEGQVKGIKSMIERGEYCDDILTQISSVKSAMNAVAKILVENHMRTCVAEKLQHGDEDIIEEFVKTVGRIIR